MAYIGNALSIDLVKRHPSPAVPIASSSSLAPAIAHRRRDGPIAAAAWRGLCRYDAAAPLKDAWSGATFPRRGLGVCQYAQVGSAFLFSVSAAIAGTLPLPRELAFAPPPWYSRRKISRSSRPPEPNVSGGKM